MRKARSEKASPPIAPWTLHSASGADDASFDQPSEFAGALRKAMTEVQDMEILFAVREQNVETVRALNRSLKTGSLTGVTDCTSARKPSEAVRCFHWPTELTARAIGKSLIIGRLRPMYDYPKDPVVRLIRAF